MLGDARSASRASSLVARLTAWINGERKDLLAPLGRVLAGDVVELRPLGAERARAAARVALADRGRVRPLARAGPRRARASRRRPQEARAPLRLRGPHDGRRVHDAAGAAPARGPRRPAARRRRDPGARGSRARRCCTSRASWRSPCPCHAFRYLYYGTLVPNTFYVKTGTGSLVWRAGLRTLRDMFAFNHTGLLAVVAPLAFANRRRIVEKATMALIAVAFMAYYVKVGVDEMQWHRLYLPALPFLVRARGARRAERRRRGAARLVGARARGGRRSPRRRRALAGRSCSSPRAQNFRSPTASMNGFNGHGDLAGTFHPDLGKFLVRHERPGALVAFQDMGSTPYHAPDIELPRLLRPGRHARSRTRATTTGSTPSSARTSTTAGQVRRRDARVLLRAQPRVGHLHHLHAAERRSSARPAGSSTRTRRAASFGDAYRDNSVQFGLWDDPRFRERYVPVRTWPRSRAYYLALLRRTRSLGADAARGRARRAAGEPAGREGDVRGRARAARLGDDEADARAARGVHHDVVEAPGPDAARISTSSST